MEEYRYEITADGECDGMKWSITGRLSTVNGAMRDLEDILLWGSNAHLPRRLDERRQAHIEECQAYIEKQKAAAQKHREKRKRGQADTGAAE